MSADAAPGEPRPEDGPAPRSPPYRTARDVRAQIIRFAIPASLEVVLHHFFGLIDQVFVASLGEASFVAAGLTVQVLSLPFVVLAALGTGASIRLARYAGARDQAAFSMAAAQTFQVAMLAAVVVTAAVAMAAPFAFGALGAAPDVLERGVFFTRLVAWSLPFMALMEIGSQALRARGDARSPMLIGLVSLGANSVLNYVLIFGWWGFPRMGLAGAGVATVLARGLGFALVCWMLLSRRHELRVRWADLVGFDGAQVRSLLRLSIPVALAQVAWLLGMLGYTRVYAALGTRELAAATIMGQLEGLCVVFSFGFGTACLTLVGQELGRKDMDGARRVATECWRLALVVSLVTAAVLAMAALFLEPIFPRLGDSTRQLAALGLWISAAMQPVKVSNMVLSMGVLRSGGDVRFLMTGETLILVGIACGWALGIPVGWGLVGVLVGKGCEELLKLGVFSWRYVSGRWIHEVG